MRKMDYTIGFQAGRAGQKWTATALTDRAKERTPEPVTFAGRPEALTFLKDSQAEGYRFSGAELVDPEQRLVKNRYFVIGSDGQLTLSGEDNGPRDTVWEIGDVMPGRDRNTGTEAVIENILQGPGCEKGLVATSRLSFVYTGSCEGLSLCRRYHHSTRRSLVHAVSTGSHTVTAAGIKASMLSGTRCYGERHQEWCRVLYRKFSPAWSR